MFFVQNEQSDVLSILFSAILTLCARYFRLPNGKTVALRQPESHSMRQNQAKRLSYCRFLWRKPFFRLPQQASGRKKARFRVRGQRKRVKGGVRARF